MQMGSPQQQIRRSTSQRFLKVHEDFLCNVTHWDRRMQYWNVGVVFVLF